ncbi:MAG: glycosyltransferase family 4 protein [Myxococcales bacterium]
MNVTPARVLMTADAVGGVWTYALELSRGLSSRGMHVALATMGPRPSPAQRSEALAIPGLSLHESEFRLEWMEDPWDDVQRAGEWLLSLERDLLPDVLHLNGYCHGALPFNAPVVVVGHSCVLSWFDAVKGAPAPSEYRRYGEAVKRGLQAASLVVAPSQAMLSELQRHYGPLSVVRVIQNGLDAEKFHVARKEPFVLAAGRLWDEAKNLRALEAAAPSLPWPVRVAGYARHPDGGEIHPSGIELLGAMAPQNLAAEMARASIYALPALYEPFGLSVLEAALSGCALVLSGIPSLRELWAGAAEFVDPRDPRSLVAGLRRLIDDDDLRRGVAAAAFSRGAALSARRMIDEYIGAYRTLSRQAEVA